MKSWTLWRVYGIALLAGIPATPQGGRTPVAAPIAIRVIEGEGALNDIRTKRARPPVVEVVDASGRPIAGATVTFLLPATGASGAFGDSGLSLTGQTDEKGRAVGRGLRPNRVAGQFRIRVTASSRGEAANASIVQTNVGAPSASSRNKKIAILALVGGAAIGGAFAATQGGKSGGGGAAAAPGGSTGTTIVGGAPSLGGPN